LVPTPVARFAVVVVAEGFPEDTVVAVETVVEVLEPGAVVASAAPTTDAVVVDSAGPAVLVVVDAEDRFDEPPHAPATSANTSARAPPPIRR
jgi:hypothetical protein